MQRRMPLLVIFSMIVAVAEWTFIFFFLVLQSMTGVSKDYLFQVYQISYVCYFTTSGVYLHDV